MDPSTRAGGHALVAKAVAGEPEAFSALLEEHYDMIYGVAFKWTGNREDAEDIAQEVCIKVGRAIRNFRMDSKFSTWLYRIVLNTAKDLQRKKRHHTSLDETGESFLEDTDQTSPERQAEQNQLWRFVRRLPAKQRDAILLVYAEDLTHGEVSQVMNCAEATVSWYIHEGRKELKVLMEAHEG